MDVCDRLRVAADLAGLAGIGVCDAAPFDDARDVLESRTADGLNGRLRFTSGDPATATDVRRSYPWARRLVVGSMAYLPAAGRPGTGPGTGRLARFAVGRPYDRLRRALGAIASELAQAGHRGAVLCDDNRLVDRAAAVRAGIGWWGKNTMVLDPRHGPWLLLGSVVTDAELPLDEPMVRDCGHCTACLPACPTGALVAPGVLDARRCIAHWLQAPGDIPLEYRAAIGDRLYGCDDCLEACPPGRRLLEASTQAAGRMELIDVLSAPDRELRRDLRHLFIPRDDVDHLRRNALVVLGNTGTEADLPLLAGFLDHPNPMLRRHARWAIDAIGGQTAARILEMVGETGS